jgi:hypothetical protein
MEKTDRIPGVEQLLAVFGSWPSFHDAEVLWVRLDRGPASVGKPLLEAMIHTFEMTNTVGTDGYYVLKNHVLVHLRFDGVNDLRLDEFNHQNVLDGLTLSEPRGVGLQQRAWEVTFHSTYGLGASFRCEALEVVCVRPCTKDGVQLDS